MNGVVGMGEKRNGKIWQWEDMGVMQPSLSPAYPPHPKCPI